MNLVITGASGFIGSNLVERLWKQFHTLKLLSRKPRLGINVPKKEWLSWEPGVPGGMAAMDRRSRWDYSPGGRAHCRKAMGCVAKRENSCESNRDDQGAG